MDLQKTFEQVQQWIAQVPAPLVLPIQLLLLALFGYFIYWMVKRLILRAIGKIVSTTRTELDDILLTRKVFNPLSFLLPFLVIHTFADTLPYWSGGVKKMSLLAMGFAGLLFLNNVFMALNDFYKTTEISKNRPLTGLVQMGQILLVIVGFVGVISILLDRPPVVLLSGIGAFTAILILTFKETILSFMAGFQIQMNDLVRVGDWIEMPQHGVDGEVLDLALHTVKVHNWDKTIASIPTYRLISESFKNWRGMQEAGGRRIKRSLLVDQNSIRFMESADWERLEKILLLKPYLEEKKATLESANAQSNPQSPLNLRRLTNIGTYRQYVKAYLKKRSDIHPGLTFLVRQLQPASDRGLPIEVYAFTNIIEWGSYEDIQADIFDHLIAAMGEFGLRPYQRVGDRA